MIENPFAISASTFVSYNSSTKSDYTTATLYVPNGTKSRYLSTEGWSNNFKAIEEMVSGPESIKLPMMATVEVGKTITLEPEIKPEGATAVLTWESKDDKIARVKGGVVLGLKEGTTDIVVRTDNGLEDWCYVTVIDPSSIYDVSADEPASSAVFSLSGQRLSAPRKGLNIIGGKKVMVK